MTSQCATIYDLYACLNIFTFALQYSSPCLSCTCHSCNSSFFWVAVTFLASYAIWEHLGEVRRSNILAMVLGDSWLVYALCVRVSVQWSDGGSFDVILGWLSGVPCFGLRSSCVLWMARLKKGVKSKRLIQGHYRWRRPRRAACQKGSCVFGKIRGRGGSCIAVGVQGMGDLLLPPFARMLGRYKISVVDKARMPHEGAG